MNIKEKITAWLASDEQAIDPVGSEATEEVVERRRMLAAEREERKWDDRHFEIVKALVVQSKLSVILGRMHNSPEAIAKDARKQADAVIAELRRCKRKGGTS